MPLRFPRSCYRTLALTAGLSARAEPDWSRFRGPNGSGISTATNVPTEFGPAEEPALAAAAAERTLVADSPGRPSLPDGVSRGDAGDARGRSQQRQDSVGALGAAGQDQVVDKRNNPASPSPAVEANGIYVFFPDYGLIAYDRNGKQQWKMPLGPVQQHLRHGRVAGDRRRSPRPRLRSEPGLIHHGGRTSGRAGAVEVERPEAKSGHATPIVWRGPDGKDQVLIPGSFLLTSYDAATGKKLWWVGGLSFEIKSTPVIGGDTIYVNGYGAPVNDPGNKINIPVADEVWKTADADGNGVLTKSEFPKFTAGFWFDARDLDAADRCRATSGRTTAPRSNPRTGCSRSALVVRAT